MIDKVSSWKFAEELVIEPEHIRRARQRAHELGVECITAATGAQLALIASAMGAKRIVEAGTGAGVSGLWMLSAGADSVLTTVDSEAEHQNAARESFLEAGLATSRTRVIVGRAQEVLGNMADGSYDLALLDVDPLDIQQLLPTVISLLRPGGVLAIPHALWRDRVPNPVLRDEETSAMRAVGRLLLNNDEFFGTVSLVGDGLILASKTTF